MHTIRFTSYKNAGYTAFLHFVSEKFDMTASLKDCALLVKLFHKNNDCTSVAQQKFRTFKCMKNGIGPMTVQGLLKMIQKFENTGSFHVQSGRGRKRIDLTVVEVTTAVQEKSSGGLKPCRPVSTVHKIPRNILHC